MRTRISLPSFDSVPAAGVDPAVRRRRKAAVRRAMRDRKAPRRSSLPRPLIFTAAVRRLWRRARVARPDAPARLGSHAARYLLAVALLDGQVLPEQYLPGRIAAEDVQELLRRVEVRPDPDLSRRFPEQHSARVSVRTRDGRVLEREQHDYEGFHTRPMSWGAVAAKFDRLAAHHVEPGLRARIQDTVRNLDEIQVEDLTRLLACTPPQI